MKTHNFCLSIARIICIVFVLSSSLFAQEISDVKWIAYDSTDTKLGCYPSWKKGQVFKYLAKYEKFKYENDSLKSENTLSNSIVSFEVIDSVSDGFIMEYKLLENKKPKEELNAKLLETMEKIARSMSESDFVIKYKVGLDGSFEKYLNETEVLNKCNEIMKALTSEKLTKQEGESVKNFKYRQEYLNLVGNGAKLFENLYAINITNFHNIYGLEMGVNDTLNYRENTPNEIIKKDIVSDNYLFISSVDTTLNEVLYVTEKYFDSDILKDIAAKAFKNSLNKKDIKDLNAELFIKNRYFFDFNAGLISYFSALKETQSVDKKTDIKTTSHEVWSLTNDLEDSKE